MRERLTDEELTETMEVAQSLKSLRLTAAVAELRDRRAKDLGHAQNHCIDCEGPLVPCTCQPDCPGGMCGRQCHLEGRPVRLSPADREALELIGQLTREVLAERPEVSGQPNTTRRRIVNALSVLDRLLSQGGGK